MLSGKDLAMEVRTDLKRKVRSQRAFLSENMLSRNNLQVEEIKNNDPNFKPGLVIVQVRRRKSYIGQFHIFLKQPREYSIIFVSLYDILGGIHLVHIG